MKIKKVKEIIKENETNDFTPQDPNNQFHSGGGRVSPSNGTLEFLQSRRNISGVQGFVSGYVSNANPQQLSVMFAGTTISTSVVIDLRTEVNRLNLISQQAAQFRSDTWDRLSPLIFDATARLSVAANEFGGQFQAILAELNSLWDEYHAAQSNEVRASTAWIASMTRLGDYILNGGILPPDPFKLDDPMVAFARKQTEERKKRDEETERQIQELKKAASESEQAAKLNQLKALGMGALLAGVVVLGAAVLAKPAIVASLGVATIRTLKAILGVTDDAAKTTIGATVDTGASTLGKLSGQVADDAANYVSRLMKGDLGPKASEIRNSIQRAADAGDEQLTKKLMQQADDLISGKGYTWTSKSRGVQKTPAGPVYTGSHRAAPSSQYIQNLNLSHTPPKGQLLSENRKRILREIKKPYTVPEIPKEKYKFNFSGKFSPQNTPDKTSSHKSDELVASGNARGQKWRTQDKYWQGYETTERMNIVYDRTGHGNQYWDRMLGEAKKKNGWRNREIQEHLNMIEHEKAMKRENPNYKSPFYKELVEKKDFKFEDEPLFKRVSKQIKKETEYQEKPSKNEFPDTPPPKTVAGWHPDILDGQKVSNRFNRLDPESAKAMPLTGNPHIDKKVKKAKQQPK